MTPTPVPKTPSPTSDDDLLDESLEETFPASDPIQPEKHDRLPPADPPGSDVHNE